MLWEKIIAYYKIKGFEAGLYKRRASVSKSLRLKSIISEILA